MAEGALTPEQIRGRVANRFYDQVNAMWLAYVDHKPPYHGCEA